MTYGNLKNLVRALLIGDNTLTKDESEILVLVEYAFDKTANETDALKLFTEDVASNRILRSGPGKQYVRKPALPSADGDEMDIDNELCFVVARYMCSFVSREKGGIHVNEAMNLIRAYNNKVATYFENLEQYGDLAEFDEFDQFGKRIYP